MNTFFHAFYLQLFYKPIYPTASYSGKTVIVTGSNVGLGLEAARHYARLNASTVILAVRSIDKGEVAKKDIEASTHCGPNVVQVWQLDLSSYESVKEFAARATKQLSRIDVLLENAGISTFDFKMAEDNESTITTNVVSTFLLALLVLPKLRETAQKHNVRPNLTITASDMHYLASFKERKAVEGKIFDTLNEKSTANMPDRYAVSKLLEVFLVREMADKRPADLYPITINAVNPGLCHSELTRDLPTGPAYFVKFLKLLAARTTEVGSRTLVHAAGAGPESHGAYMSDCRVTTPSKLVRSDEGKAVQKRLWKELTAKLEKISPGVVGNL